MPVCSPKAAVVALSCALFGGEVNAQEKANPQTPQSAPLKPGDLVEAPEINDLKVPTPTGDGSVFDDALRAAQSRTINVLLPPPQAENGLVAPLAIQDQVRKERLRLDQDMSRLTELKNARLSLAHFTAFGATALFISGIFWGWLQNRRMIEALKEERALHSDNGPAKESRRIRELLESSPKLREALAPFVAALQSIGDDLHSAAQFAKEPLQSELAVISRKCLERVQIMYRCGVPKVSSRSNGESRPILSNSDVRSLLSELQERVATDARSLNQDIQKSADAIITERVKSILAADLPPVANSHCTEELKSKRGSGALRLSDSRRELGNSKNVLERAFEQGRDLADKVARFEQRAADVSVMKAELIERATVSANDANELIALVGISLLHVIDSDPDGVFLDFSRLLVRALERSPAAQSNEMGG